MPDNKKISELTTKATPVDADMFALVDTVAAPIETKKTLWSNIKSVLKTYFDGVYDAINAASGAISAHLIAFTHGDIHPKDGDTALGAVGTKNPPIDADKAIYRNSAASDALVTSTWTQIKAFLKTYFDGVYSSIGALFNVVEDTTPQLGGALDLNSKNISMVFEPSADVTAQGIIVTLTVDTNAEGIGAPLFMAADGHLDTADADADTTSPCVALALETGTGSKKVLLHGMLRVDAWNWNTGPGFSASKGCIYVSTTVGTLTQTQPSGTNDVIQPVGFALSDDVIYFQPSMLYFTHT